MYLYILSGVHTEEDGALQRHRESLKLRNGPLSYCTLHSKFLHETDYSHTNFSQLSLLPISPFAASPTSIVWWDTMDQRHFCVTGSEVSIHLYVCSPSPPSSKFYFLQVGEIAFFDLKAKEVVSYVYVSGCIDVILLASLTDSATYLLVKLEVYTYMYTMYICMCKVVQLSTSNTMRCCDTHPPGPSIFVNESPSLRFRPCIFSYSTPTQLKQHTCVTHT